MAGGVEVLWVVFQVKGQGAMTTRQAKLHKLKLHNPRLHRPKLQKPEPQTQLGRAAVRVFAAN